ASYGVCDEAADGLAAGIGWLCGTRVGIEILLDLDAAGANAHPTRGWELLAAAIDRQRRWNVAPAEIVSQRREIDRCVHPIDLAQRRQLAGEGDGADAILLRRRERKVQGLLSHAVAREEGGVVGGVEDREGEHPVEFLAAVFAPDVIREKQNFGVAVRSPVIVRARLLELAPQLAKV